MFIKTRTMNHGWRYTHHDQVTFFCDSHQDTVWYEPYHWENSTKTRFLCEICYEYEIQDPKFTCDECYVEFRPDYKQWFDCYSDIKKHLKFLSFCCDECEEHFLEKSE